MTTKLSDEVGTRPQWCRCHVCRFEWIGMYWPQMIKDACKLMGAIRCPKCATGPQYIQPINPPAAAA